MRFSFINFSSYGIFSLLVLPLAPLRAEKGCHDKPLYTSGFYLGLAQGLSHMRGTLKGQYADPGDPAAFLDPESSSRTFSSKDNSWVIDGLAGYWHFFLNGLSLGGDIALSYTNNEIKEVYRDTTANGPNGENPINLKVKKVFSLIPSATLGYRLHKHFHIFAKVGMAITRYELSMQNPRLFDPVIRNRTTYSFVSTLGLEYAFNKHWSVALTTSYENSPQLGIEGHAVNTVALTDRDDKLKFHITPNTFTQKINIIYRF